MTDKIQSMRDLLVKVEDGELPPTKLIGQAFGCRRLPNGWDVAALIKWIMGDTIEAMGSAKALHEAVLPGWDLQICTYEDDLFEVSVSKPTSVKTYDGLSEIISRAWLIAQLRALIAQATP